MGCSGVGKLLDRPANVIPTYDGAIIVWLEQGPGRPQIHLATITIREYRTEATEHRLDIQITASLLNTLQNYFHDQLINARSAIMKRMKERREKISTLEEKLKKMPKESSSRKDYEKLIQAHKNSLACLEKRIKAIDNALIALGYLAEALAELADADAL